jgi:hypothetical protein
MRKSTSKLRLDLQTIRNLDLGRVAGGMLPRDRGLSDYPCPSMLNQCVTGALDCPSKWTFCGGN